MTEAVKIDVTKLTPLSPEVISKQATINIGKKQTKKQKLREKKNNRLIENFFIGTIGHVAHGKSTVVKAISGVQVKIIDSCSSPDDFLNKKITNLVFFFFFLLDCSFQE